MKRENLEKLLEFAKSLHEQPVNSLAGGKIAGTAEAGDDSPVRKRKRKRYIYQKGVRKLWKPENGGAN